MKISKKKPKKIKKDKKNKKKFLTFPIKSKNLTAKK